MRTLFPNPFPKPDMISDFQKIIHRHGRWIFAILLFIVIVAFLLMDFAGIRGRSESEKGRVATVYGQIIPPKDLDLAERRYRLNVLMTTGQNIPTGGRVDSLVREQVLRRMALEHKATRMGLSVADSEVLDMARHFFIRKDGTYDQNAYNQFLSEGLAPRRLTEGDFEAMIRENILLSKLQGLIASTAKITPQQVITFASDLADRRTIAACRFDVADFLSKVKPTHEQVIAFFKANPDLFHTEEKARVAYVTFPIDANKAQVSDDEIEKLYQANAEAFRTPDGKIRPLSEVLSSLRSTLQHQKAARAAFDRATEFTIKLISTDNKSAPSFEAVAKSENLSVQHTGWIGANELVSGISTPEFSQTALRLNEEIPVSDPIEGTKAFYVLKLLGHEPSVALTFDQAKNAAQNACQTRMALDLARETGEKNRKEIATLLSQGKTFEQATTTLKLKFKTFKGFNALDEASTDHFENSAREAAFPLPSRTLSAFIPTSYGGYFVYVSSRDPTSSAELSKLEEPGQIRLLQMEQQRVVMDFQQAIATEALGLPTSASTAD